MSSHFLSPFLITSFYNKYMSNVIKNIYVYSRSDISKHSSRYSFFPWKNVARLRGYVEFELSPVSRDTPESISVYYRVPHESKEWKYRQSLSIAIVRRNKVKSELASESVGYRAPWISASAIPTRIHAPVPKHGTLHSSLATYWGQKEHFSETRVAMRDTSANGATNGILRIGSDGPFVFIHDAFSLSPTHPDGRCLSVEIRLACPHLCTTSKSKTSLLSILLVHRNPRQVQSDELGTRSRSASIELRWTKLLLTWRNLSRGTVRLANLRANEVSKLTMGWAISSFLNRNDQL